MRTRSVIAATCPLCSVSCPCRSAVLAITCHFVITLRPPQWPARNANEPFVRRFRGHDGRFTRDRAASSSGSLPRLWTGASIRACAPSPVSRVGVVSCSNCWQRNIEPRTREARRAMVDKETLEKQRLIAVRRASVAADARAALLTVPPRRRARHVGHEAANGRFPQVRVHSDRVVDVHGRGRTRVPGRVWPVRPGHDGGAAPPAGCGATTVPAHD